MVDVPVSLHPSKDPRQSIVAFGRLLAQLTEPFADRTALLDAVALRESDFADLEAKWAERMRTDPNAVALFEQAFQAEKGAHSQRSIAEDSTDDARFLSPRQEFREEAAQVEASAPLDDNQTLPISGPIAAAALPFQPGEFHPLPSLPRSRERRRENFDPDATRLPEPNDNETLPFAPSTAPSSADASDKPKRG